MTSWSAVSAVGGVSIVPQCCLWLAKPLGCSNDHALKPWGGNSHIIWRAELLNLIALEVSLEENWSILTICCNLFIATHAEKMHERINWVVNQRFFIAIIEQLATKHFWLTNQSDLYIHFLPWVVMDGYSGQVFPECAKNQLNLYICTIKELNFYILWHTPSVSK